MSKYPFKHDGSVFILSDDHSEVAYYARDGKKYKRIRLAPYRQWETCREREVDDMTFWMVVACIERKR